MTGSVTLITPDWPAPDNIVAFSTCRSGGVSTGVYSGLNLALHVGDEALSVSENRQQLMQTCDGLERIQWLHQVHGCEVVNSRCGIDNTSDTVCPTADGSHSRESAVACAVLTADCLPVLFCDRAGNQVAAAHAGWRGLAAGVLENTVQQLEAVPQQIMAWLGPAISQPCFEVGPEVRECFLDAADTEQQALIDSTFKPNTNRDNHYFLDLYQLARIRLQAIGVVQCYGGHHCTYRAAQRFYSYRRDGVTGRMATIIYKR